MEKVSIQYPTRFNPRELKEQILKDPDVAIFIKEQGLTPDQVQLSLTKLNQFRMERDRFNRGDEAYVAKGYQPILVMNEGYADVSYKETKEHHQAQEKQAVSDRIHLVNLPKSYKQIGLEDIMLDDIKRIEAFEAIVSFVEHFPQITKGLYLYGDMGVGKSFMLAALARDLSEKKGLSTTLLHFPSFAIDIRHAIKTGNVKEEIDRIKMAEILVLDDIGAEQASAWIRDEVLQVILQYRMLENLPTFFTSNYSMADLEKKLSSGKADGEVWEAKRVMERIRYLATELHLEGENRR